MDAPYQARDDTTVVWAGLGGDSIFGIMPRKAVEVKPKLLQHSIPCAVVALEPVGHWGLALHSYPSSMHLKSGENHF